MKRALAVFAKTPVPGQVKTRLAPFLSPTQCAELYRCMLLDTVARVGQVGVTTVVFYDGDEGYFRETMPGVELLPQHPGGLGERLEEAFTFLAGAGYPLRAAIGTDAPDLPLSYIEQAYAALEGEANAVFGPAEDGGYYLVALKGPHHGIFQGIPWSTSAVLEASLQRVQAAGISSSLIPSWYDVDCYRDLWRPGLQDPRNGAPLTRDFISNLAADTQPLLRGAAG